MFRRTGLRFLGELFDQWWAYRRRPGRCKGCGLPLPDDSQLTGDYCSDACALDWADRTAW